MYNNMISDLCLSTSCETWGGKAITPFYKVSLKGETFFISLGGDS